MQPVSPMKSRRFRTLNLAAKAAKTLGFRVGRSRLFAAVPGTRDRRRTAATGERDRRRTLRGFKLSSGRRYDGR
jgi:hypothetical protein